MLHKVFSEFMSLPTKSFLCGKLAFSPTKPVPRLPAGIERYSRGAERKKREPPQGQLPNGYSDAGAEEASSSRGVWTRLSARESICSPVVVPS